MLKLMGKKIFTVLHPPPPQKKGGERSGIVIDSRLRGREFEPHQCHCVNPSLVLVQPRMTHPYITEILLMGRKESNQTNKNKVLWIFLSWFTIGKTCRWIYTVDSLY